MFAVGLLLALVPAVLLWGFTVDDALIPARYAAHLASGAGYRFNASGPVTDGVTPLGWAHLLAPFARGGPLAALGAAKIIGLLAWTASAGAVAVAIDRLGQRPARFAALALLACSAPLAAWSVAGLETGLVTAFAALAAAGPTLGWRWAGMAFAGLGAALRPELLPWALVLAFTPPPAAAPAPQADVAAIATEPRRRMYGRHAARVGLAMGPFLLVAALRLAVFGRAAPLSALAKAPDAELGARYALACFLLTGPIALLAPMAWARLGGHARGLVVAVFAHFVAIALAGGDWMPLSRLAVPVLPTVALAAAHVLCVADARVAVPRLALALAGELFAAWKVGPSAAHVGRDRMAVIEQLRPALASAKVVAAVDVGWVGAATDATIVDLAGVTDPTVAALPGGHTSRHVPEALFSNRRVDTLVLLVHKNHPLRDPWYETMFAYAVEYRIAVMLREEFDVVAVSEGPLRYLVLRRADQRDAALRR
jgi:hypothetical protein